MERVGDKLGKNREVLFDRPKPTAGCNANGRRRRMSFLHLINLKYKYLYLIGGVHYL
jgi:hypothetical protein